MSILFKPNGTLNVATDPCDLEESVRDKVTDIIQSIHMTRCKNLRLDLSGVIKTRDGCTNLGTGTYPVHRLIEQSGYRYLFASTGIYRNESSIETGLTSAAWAAMLYNSYNDTSEEVFCTNGTDRKRIDGSSVYEWGIDAPTTAPTITSGSEQGSLSGAYNAKYTYARKDGDTVICESNPSDPAVEAVTLDSGHLQMLVTQPTDDQVTHIRFYRTLTGGGIYYYDSDTPISDIITDGYFAITKSWEDDGDSGLEYYDLLGKNFSNSYSWEDDDGYFAGNGFLFTTEGTSYSYTYSWESDYSTTVTITEWTVTGQDDYLYAGEYFDLSSYDYYIDGESYQFTNTTGYTYTWEPYYAYTDAEYLDVDDMVKLVPIFGFEDTYHGYYILHISDASLGAEVAINHDRPPLGISFLLGPNFNGTCFAIVGNLLYFSLPKQPEYWPASYNVEIGPVQYPGQSAAFFNGIPHVLTKTEIYAIQGTGADSFFPYRMNALTGCQGPLAACAVHGQGIFHIGTDGVYLFNGSEDGKVTQAHFEPIFRGETIGTMPGMSDAANSWIIPLGNRVFIGYVSSGHTYPTNVLVVNLDTNRTTYYSYSMEIVTVEVDEYNHRILGADSDGNVWHLDDPDVTTDDDTAISWEVQSKDFMLQTRAHFPRWVKYDVDASGSDSATGQVILEDEVHQSHTLSGSRNTKKRLVATGNGKRMALRLTGSGPVSIYAIEAE